MSNQIFENNGVNGTGTPREGLSSGRCSPTQQRGPGGHPATARVKWNTEVNKLVIQCFYISKLFDEEGKAIRGYRKRMFREWREKGMFESTEQCVFDQARAIRKNGWLTELEMKAIIKQVEDESQSERCREQDTIADAETKETDVGTVEEEINDAEDSIGDIEGDLSEEHQTIVEQLKKTMVEGRTGHGIMFKKVNKRVFKVQTDRVNETIKYFKSKTIRETSKLIRAASVLAAERTGLKKAEHRKENETRWKRRIEGDIDRLRQEVKFLERETKRELVLKKKRN